MQNQPRVFLSYLLYDNNLNFVDFGFAQVLESAEIDAVRGDHELLERNNIKIEKGGYIYIYVSNESNQNMEVYFDDLKVTHEYGDIVAGGDYYPFGLAMDGREVTREDYRYGYQGQFSEKDEDTGWNSFEARQYDSRIGKWISPDPARQFASPYVGMGNNPVNGVDPDGEWVPGAGLWNNIFKSDERIYAERYAGSWSSEHTDYSAAQIAGRWGIIGEDKASIMGNAHTRETWMTFSSVNKDGTVVDTDGWFLPSQLASGTIKPDYTLELFLFPVAKGASLVYNATVRGVLKSSLTGASRLGGSAAKINYYTYKAAQAGYSTTLSGARVRAGVFVQLNHNFGRMMVGKGWKTLYSNAPATIMGRQWQNQAIGSGLLGIGVGTGSLYYNLNK